MMSCKSELTIDFGPVGDRFGKKPFRIRLDAGALDVLTGHARNAHRVYELFLIDRPGDLWEYVWVSVEEAPDSVLARIERAREQARPRSRHQSHPWPDACIPFTDLDSLFYWAWDDTSPEDEAWLEYRDSPTMLAYSRQLMAIVLEAQGSLTWVDDLLRHVVTRIRSGTHPYRYLDRRVAIKKDRENSPNSRTFSSAFYEELQDLLRDPELTSVAYRGNGDYTLLKILATEQRRRSKLTGHLPEHALTLSALVNRKANTDAWDAEIRFFDEGLDHGDLYIDGGGLGGCSIKELIEHYHQIPGRFVLSAKNEGLIDGFECESGDGWTLYRRTLPDRRRRGLERIVPQDRNHLKPLLKFEGHGSSLFKHDKTILVVGETVATSIRILLAEVVSEWQLAEGDPLLIILGDSEPFISAGCRDQVVLTERLMRDGEGGTSEWLTSELGLRPWIDVVITLEAPAWIDQVLGDRIVRQREPWLPWVISTSDTDSLKADLVLANDLLQNLAEARKRAGGFV